MKNKINFIKNLEKFLEQEEDKFYTYIHYTLNENIPFYVGKGKGYRCLSVDRSQWWQNVVNKHNYYIVIDSINLTEEQAFLREKELVIKFGRKQNGGTLVNLTDGGEGVSGKIYTDEERKAKSLYMKNHPEIWEHLPHGYGEDNPNYGNKGDLNPLSKKVIKLSLNGEYITEYNSTVEAGLNNDSLPSAIAAVCNNHRNQLKGFFYVYKDDYESGNYSLHLGVTNKKAVYQIDPINLNIIKEYNCINDVTKDGFNATNVSQVCRGEKNSHKNFTWCFVNDYESFKQNYKPSKNIFKPFMKIDKITGEVLKEYNSREELEDIYRLSCVYNVCNGKEKSHKGFFWKFKN